MDTKYIFVIGEAVTSTHRAVVAASLARVLLSRGLKVNMLKCVPCLNSDFETISNDSEELFVTHDGSVCDFALGYYERFTDVKMSGSNCITTGRIIQNVMSRERRGEYVGERVQIVPHATDEVKRCVEAQGAGNDFVVVEIGGSLNNVETIPWVEAIKQLKEEREEDCAIVNIVNVEETSADEVLPCDVVVETDNAEEASIYAMPLQLIEQQIDEQVLWATGLHDVRKTELSEWRTMLERMQSVDGVVSIGIVGENAEREPAYRSLKESLLMAGARNGVKVELKLLRADQINDGSVEALMSDVDGVVIASGIGSRGLEGRIAAVKWCRENDVPTLAIGLGMHSLVIEYARNVLGLREANSTEADARTAHNVIDLMTDQKAYSGMGGAMRMGVYRCELAEGSRVAYMCGSMVLNERHYHRGELNNLYMEQLKEAGLRCSGVNPTTRLVEVVEIVTHKLMVGVQFQPEYNNSALQPNELIMGFVRQVKEEIK